MKAILTIGIPCSGKSTWAAKQQSYQIERDQLREIYEIHLKDMGRSKFEKFITDKQYYDIKHYALKGRDIIISDTNLNTTYRKELTEYLESLGYDVEIKLFPITLDEAFKRNEKRAVKTGRYIPLSVLSDMYERFNEQFGIIEKYTPPEDKPSCYLVDIDGTLAYNDGNRGWYDWDKVGGDKPKDQVINVVNSLYDKSHKIVLLSGRDSICRKETETWLAQHKVKYDVLYMRPEGSTDKDYNVKLELFNKHIRNDYNVRGVFDDRPQVVQLWHDLGLTCFSLNKPYNFF